MAAKGALTEYSFFPWKNRILAESKRNLVSLELLSKYKVMCYKDELFFFVPSAMFDIILRSGAKKFSLCCGYHSALCSSPLICI